jgi:fimbrial chaperone protein
MTPTQRGAALTLTNTGTEAASFQIRLFRWSQVDGEDRLEPAPETIVSPPFAAIPAGAAYTVRIARPASQTAGSEIGYRLVIDELPKTSEARREGVGVAMLLRASVPVFVTPSNAQARIEWRAWKDETGLHVEAVNRGDRRARIAGLTARTAEGRDIRFGDGLNAYVLAGASRRFDAPLIGPDGAESLSSRTLTLTAQDGGRRISESVLVGGD